MERVRFFMSCLPNPPQLFFCEQCQVYFYSNSKLERPTHTTCKGHKTELVLNYKESLKFNRVKGS